MIDLAQTLDLDHPEAVEFLRGIQGNIVKGHGRRFTAHVLLTMTGAPREVRRWIAGFGSEQVTSAAAAREQAAVHGRAGGVGEPFAMFLLAPNGYRHLGFVDDDLPAPADRFNPSWGREYFLRGMKGQSTLPRRYNDPGVTAWELPYRRDVHAMVLLADDDRARLDRSVAAVLASAEGVFEQLVTERGAALTARFPHGERTIEHFGFNDGVSQPLMIQQDVEAEVKMRGNRHWDPSAPLSLTLAEEPGGGTFGSFMVFRKLEQNVKAFWDSLRAFSDVSGVPAEDLGALAVGRYRDGTPAVPATAPDPTADLNDFHYDRDPDGARCPFHAHIRKTNPRGDLARFVDAMSDADATDFERARRIVRRGITYGDRPDLATGGTPPSRGVGLLFMCFQANLDQFAIQQDGSDSNDFINPDVGVDAVIGRNPAPVPQTWPGAEWPPFAMANLVTMRGGEYFFAPSIPFLTGLTT